MAGKEQKIYLDPVYGLSFEPFCHQAEQKIIPMPDNNQHLDLSTLESWLWDAACVIRGPLDAPKFKDYILPLIFLKRLSDVFEDEVKWLGQKFGDERQTTKHVEDDHKLARFYIPPIARRPAIRQRTTGLDEYLTDPVRAVARENPKLQVVIDVAEFNATIASQRIADDGRLVSLIEVLCRASGLSIGNESQV